MKLKWLSNLIPVLIIQFPLPIGEEVIDIWDSLGDPVWGRDLGYDKKAGSTVDTEWCEHA